MDLFFPFSDDMNYCLGWDPGNLPRYEIRSLFQNDPTDFTESKDSSNIYINENISEKQDIGSEKLEKSLEVSDIEEKFHQFSDVFKSDISHKNYEWKVPDFSNNTEKHDILTGKSEETLEVSNTDEEFHGFSDNEDDEISEVEDLNIKGVLILENFFTLVQISQKRCQITPPCIFSLNLFVTSKKNETTNSSIHEFEVLQNL